MSDWTSEGEPLEVNETESNDEPTDEDIKEAKDNYARMSPSLRMYVDALNRKFPS